MRIGLDEWWQTAGKLASNEIKRRAHDLHEDSSGSRTSHNPRELSTTLRYKVSMRGTSR